MPASRICPSRGTARRLIGAGSLAFLIAIGMSACGGSPEPSIGDLLEQAEGLEGLEDLEELLGTDGTGASITVDGTELAMGNNGRPEWLDDWIQFPEETEYLLAIDEPSSGERLVAATVPGMTGEALETQLFSMIEAQGYERMGDTGYFVKSGEQALDIGVFDRGTGADFNWEYSSQSEQSLRDTYAPTETTGTLTLVVDGTTTEETGDCSLRSMIASFAAENSSFSLQTFSDDQQQQTVIFGSVLDSGPDPTQLGKLWMLSNPGEATHSLTGNGFVIEGMFADSFSQDSPVPGTVSLVCN